MTGRILVLPVPGALRVTIDGRVFDLPRSREDLNYLALLCLKAGLETPPEREGQTDGEGADHA